MNHKYFSCATLAVLLSLVAFVPTQIVIAQEASKEQCEQGGKVSASERDVPAKTVNITLKITITNLGPQNGSLVTPLWFAFQNGTFAVFVPGCPATQGLRRVAEDGVSGVGLLNDVVFNNAVTKGEPIDIVPPFPDLLGGEFAASEAAKHGQIEGILAPDPISPIALGFFPGNSNSTTRIISGDFRNYRYFSYAAMVFPSNDAFIASEQPIEVFDRNGNFIGADFIVFGSQVWDAGTEENDEVPSDVPFSLSAFGKGPRENSRNEADGGVVHIHPGLKPLGSGGLLDFTPIFSGANFKAPGYQVAHIVIEAVQGQ